MTIKSRKWPHRKRGYRKTSTDKYITCPVCGYRRAVAIQIGYRCLICDWRWGGGTTWRLPSEDSDE